MNAAVGAGADRRGDTARPAGIHPWHPAHDLAMGRVAVEDLGPQTLLQPDPGEHQPGRSRHREIGQVAAGSRMVMATSMLPRTALVYGHRRSAPTTSSSASARSWIEGSLTSSSAVRPKRFSTGPIPTLAVTIESSTARFLRRATLMIAF